MIDGPQRQHQSAQRRWDDSGEAALTMREMVLGHDRDIDDLKAWRNELRGAMGLVRITLGASLVSGVLAVLTIGALLANAVPRP